MVDESMMMDKQLDDVLPKTGHENLLGLDFSTPDSLKPPPFFPMGGFVSLFARVHQLVPFFWQNAEENPEKWLAMFADP